MVALHLVRHGRTTLNAQGRFRGRQDPPLDEQGIRDARRAASLLGSAGLVSVVASPLRRALETAGVIASPDGLPVAIEPGLQDIDYGRWEGWSYEEAEADDPPRYRRLREAPRSFVAPGGESMVEVEERAVAALDRLAAGPGPVAAVSHDVVLRLLVIRLAGLPDEGFWGFPLVTGGIVDLEATGGSIRLSAEPGGGGWRGDGSGATGGPPVGS